MKISLRPRHALTVEYGAFSQKIDHATIFQEILNLEGHQNRITGSKVAAIFTKQAPKPILSISCDVSVFVCLSLPLGGGNKMPITQLKTTHCVYDL